MPGSGTGVRRPFSSGGPSSVRTHSRPVTAPFAAHDANRLRLPQKNDRVLLGELIFVGEGGHFGLAAAIDEVNRFGAEAPRGGDDVDRGVPCTDASDAPAHFDFVQRIVPSFSR